MVAYLPAEYCESQAECGMTEDSDADVRAKNTMVGRQEPVARYRVGTWSRTMQRVPFGRSLLDPRRANNFLDSCAFDPKYAPEDDAAQQIRTMGDDGQVKLVLTHSIQKEIDHPNTPMDVKREAAGMVYTIETSLNPDEVARKAQIYAVLTRRVAGRRR